MIVYSVCTVGVSWARLWIAKWELDNMFNGFLVNGRYLRVINTGIVLPYISPGRRSHRGRGGGVVVALAYTPMGPVSFPGMGDFCVFSLAE